MDKIPERIWLQGLGESNGLNYFGVTWCAEKINENDVEYVLVTKSEESKEKEKKETESI